jgi:protein O-mannosyl-transferase
MSAKNQKYNKQAIKPKANSSKPATTKKENAYVNKYTIVGGILLLTFWCYHYSLHNQFLNWDDGIYVFGNKYIKSFSADNLRMMLFHGITPSNYHPLAMVSLALNWHFSQAAPMMYYFTNIVIHLCNVVLVFLLATGLCTRLKLESKRTFFIAAFSALWFGIHPMHVESVSWIAERKDVLYTFFYFLGLLSYLKYIDSVNKNEPMANSLKWYGLTFLLFVISCLSKPMAVSFPLMLCTIDLLLQRKLERKLIVEKILFFLGALFFGGLAYHIQKDSGAVADFQSISFTDRIFFAFYGFNTYLLKLIAPFNQNAFYPYPDIRPTVALPAVYYVMPIITLFIAAIPFYFKWKKKEPLYRIALFGLSFYFLNIVFVLQFISCGDAIIADRYTYIAYFGPVFAIIYLASELIFSMPAYKNIVIAVLAGFSIMFAVLCQARTKVWHNPATFWTDVIEKSDMHSQLPYLNLGNYYVDSGKYDKAYPEYVLLARLGMKDGGVFRNLAMIYGMRKQFDSSFYCFGKALQYDSTNASIYTNRAITYANLGKFDLALKDFSKAYELDTTKDVALAQRAGMLMQLGKYGDAVTDFNALIRRNPTEPSNYLSRGNAWLNGGNPGMAVKDYLHLLELQSDNGTCMYDLSVAYDKLGDEKDALNYALKANQNKFQVPVDYLNRLQKLASR